MFYLSGIKKKRITNNIKPGQVIVGLASDGQANYETEFNGGMGSNGLTSARHDLFNHEYAGKYPESFDPEVPRDLVYTGPFRLIDVDEVTGVTMGKLVLSPTRTYMPIVVKLLAEYREQMHGMIHCSGGAQTKVLKFVENVHIIKDDLFETPRLFSLIKEASGTAWEEMYRVFNMGHRLEIYADPAAAQGIIDVAGEFGVEAKIVGRVEENVGNKLSIRTGAGEFIYH